MLPDNIIKLLSDHGILLECVCYITHLTPIFNVNLHYVNISRSVPFIRSQLNLSDSGNDFYISIMCLLHIQALFPYSNLT